MTKYGWFDTPAFYRALDATRLSRELTWKDVAAESGVSASTLTRISQGKRPDVDGLAALASWSGLSTDDFVRSEAAPSKADPLSLISSFLSSDERLSPDAARSLDQIIRASYTQLRDRD